MENISIKIPEPCHEGWEKMTLNEKGRFCDSCCKTVIDFTNKSPKEIKEYLLANRGEKICGNFKKTQLNSIVIQIPEEVFKYELSFKKLFLLALLLTMGSVLFSCKTDGNTQKIDKVEVIHYVSRHTSALGMISEDPINYPKKSPNDDLIPIQEIEEPDDWEAGDIEVTYSPEIPPLYVEIKAEIISLLNNNFKKELKGENITIDFTIDRGGKNEVIYVKTGEIELEEKIKLQLESKITPLIVVEVKKDSEYDMFYYHYKLTF